MYNVYYIYLLYISADVIPSPEWTPRLRSHIRANLKCYSLNRQIIRNEPGVFLSMKKTTGFLPSGIERIAVLRRAVPAFPGAR